MSGIIYNKAVFLILKMLKNLPLVFMQLLIILGLIILNFLGKKKQFGLVSLLYLYSILNKRHQKIIFYIMLLVLILVVFSCFFFRMARYCSFLLVIL